MPKALKIDQLNRTYEEAEQADRAVFAEQRSNILLIAGEHYSKRGAESHQRLRTSSDSESQKLRLTKNHLHKVVRIYVANILTHAPGVSVAPKNEDEIQDQKSADLNQAVWADIKVRYRLKDRVRQYLHDFVGIGEVCVKIIWDPSAGEFLGYEQAASEDGEPLFDESGAPLPDEERPRFTGGFVFERVYGYNLLRHASARDMRDAECWIVRKLVDMDQLKAKYSDDPDKLKMITEAAKDEFIVFDSDRAGYNKTKNQALVREFYWPISNAYPEGYFAITTQEGILDEGPLPGGIFPLVWQGFDEYPSTPRGRSIIKVARPFQAEINRASSQMAMHQITVGDDKVLYQTGSKLQQGALLPGVRGISYAGAPPTILPGRDGGQYLNYINSQIAELYDVLMLDEENQEKNPGQLDPMSLFYRSLKQRKKFASYGEKFEAFLIEFAETCLKLAKFYYPDDMVVAAVGKNERINISEFKSTDPLCYRVKLEEREETLETQFGRQLTMNHILQYASTSMTKDDIGKIVRQMPFANAEEAFGDLTLDYDAVKNDMLQMERGIMPPLGKYDDPNYVLKKLVSRTRQSDFQFLPVNVQQLYTTRIAMYERVLHEQQAKLQAAKNEFIPVDGAMIATDMYVENPAGAEKPSKRVRIPYRALDWLVKQLETQGASLDKLETQNKGVISEMADMLLGNQSQSRPQLPQASGSAFNNAPASAVGVSG